MLDSDTVTNGPFDAGGGADLAEDAVVDVLAGRRGSVEDSVKLTHLVFPVHVDRLCIGSVRRLKDCDPRLGIRAVRLAVTSWAYARGPAVHEEVELVETQQRPPDVAELVKALKPVLRNGLPLDPDLDDARLLGLRSVVARAIEPDERLSRVKALDGLLQRLLAYYPDDVLSEAARVLFGLAPGSRGKTLTDRREQAARETGYEAVHFRKRIEPKILKQLAWQLHQDAQTYVPRGGDAPPALEVSGDTPYIAAGDVSAKEQAEHEELLSQLWAHVYALRAVILRVERLKNWPYDETEPELSRQKLEQALAHRKKQIEFVRLYIKRYIAAYGQRVTHGETEFNADALLRLAGWTGD